MFATLLTGLHCRPNELLPLEDIQHAPRGWRRGSAPRPDLLLRLRIATKQTKAFEFEQHVLAISDPEHPEYGQQMKRDEVKAKLRPSQEASERILSWLRYEGVPQSHIEDDGDVSPLVRGFQAKMTCEVVASTLLNAKTQCGYGSTSSEQD